MFNINLIIFIYRSRLSSLLFFCCCCDYFKEKKKIIRNREARRRRCLTSVPYAPKQCIPWKRWPSTAKRFTRAASGARIARARWSWATLLPSRASTTAKRILCSCSKRRATMTRRSAANNTKPNGPTRRANNYLFLPSFFFSYCAILLIFLSHTHKN